MDEFNIDGFTIIEKIGEGGMATVWKANQESLDRLVAIKVLSPKLAAHEEDISLFRQEAQSAAKLKHSGIVQVYDAKTDKGLYSLVMEFIDGYTVGDWQRRKKVLDETNVILVAESVAMALEYAWNTNKIIHCDIKPDNVMIDADGTVKLADLGLSRTISNLESAQDLEEVMGTPAYMSPEQVQGETNIDCRSDIYSLGAMMYHMSTGKMLFEGYSEEQVMEMQLSEVPPPAKSINNGVSQGMSDLIALMLEKDKEKRPKNWQTVIKKLHDLKAGDKITGKKVLADPSINKKKVANKKNISVKHHQHNIKLQHHVDSVNTSFSKQISEVDKKKSPVLLIIIGAAVLIVGIIAILSMNHANKIRIQKEAEIRERAIYHQKVLKEQKVYNAIMTYYNNNPQKFGYVISKLKDFNKRAQIEQYIELSNEKIKMLQKQYDKQVKGDKDLLEWQAEKYINQGDFIKAKYIYTGYNGVFPDETEEFRKQKAEEIQKLIDQQVVKIKQEEKNNVSTKKIINSTLNKISASSPSAAKSFLHDQIKENPEIAENNKIKELNTMLNLLDKKAVIIESYLKIKEIGEPITLKTKNRDISAKVTSLENDGLNIGLINSDGIINSYTFIPYSQLSDEEMDARIKDNKDAYNINKGLEHAKNKSYDLAELYFKCLPENYSTLMLDIINKERKSTYDLKAEEDLTKIFRAFNMEIYTLDDLTDIEPPSLSEEQVEKLQSAINTWRSEYSQNTLNFQFSAE
jgi:serine/threonine protein kinase